MDDFTLPDGGYGWVIVLASFILNFIVAGMPRGFGVMFVILTEKFDATATETAWVHALFNTLRMLLGPVSSMLCLRFTARKVVITGGLLLFTGVTTSAFARNMYHLYFTYGILGGLGGSLLFVPSLTVVSDYFDKKKGIAMAISSAGAGIGTLAFANMFTFFIGYYGFCGGMLLVGSVTFHAVIAGALLRPLEMPKAATVTQIEKQETTNFMQVEEKINEKPKVTKQNEQQSNVCSSDPNTSKPSRCCGSQMLNQFSLFKNKSFLIYALAILVMPFCLLVVLLFIAGHAKEFGIAEEKRAFIISVMGISDMIGRIVFGILFDLKCIRTRRRSLHSVLGIMFGLAAFSIGLCDSFLTLCVICGVHSLFEGAFHAQRASVLSEIVPRDLLSMSVGYLTLFQGIGNFVWPILGGQLRDHLHSYKEVFYVGGSLLMIASLMYLIDYVVYVAFTDKSLCVRRGQDHTLPQDMSTL